MKHLKQIVKSVGKLNKKSIMVFIFGERIEGEKLTEPVKFPIRDIVRYEFEQWCKEFNVSTVHNRKSVHFNN